MSHADTMSTVFAEPFGRSPSGPATVKPGWVMPSGKCPDCGRELVDYLALGWAEIIMGREDFSLAELVAFARAAGESVPAILSAGGWFRVLEGDTPGAERFIATPEPPSITRLRADAGRDWALTSRRSDLR